MLQMLDQLVIWGGSNTAIADISVLFGSGTDCLTWKILGWLNRYFTGTMWIKGVGAKILGTCWYNLILNLSFLKKNIIDMNLVQSKLNDLMHEQWSNEVHNKPKLRTYVQIKDTFEPEPYVLSNISRQRKSLLAQIRLGILPIKIETGRFRSLSVDQRICELCEMRKVENEIHFICECPLYNDFRETLYEHAKLTRNDFITMGMQGKFVHLMKYMWREVSHYLVQAWNRRKDKLYND